MFEELGVSVDHPEQILIMSEKVMVGVLFSQNDTDEFGHDVWYSKTLLELAREKALGKTLFMNLDGIEETVEYEIREANVVQMKGNKFFSLTFTAFATKS